MQSQYEFLTPELTGSQPCSKGAGAQFVVCGHTGLPRSILDTGGMLNLMSITVNQPQ